MATVDLINQYSADLLNTTTNTTKELGKDDFLRLLVTQLKNQDPLDPLKNEEFIAQLAQFNSLEQMINLNKSFEQMLSMQSLAQASGLIGKNVSWFDETTGEMLQGEVSEIVMENQAPLLVVGNNYVSVEQIFSISPV